METFLLPHVWILYSVWDLLDIDRSRSPVSPTQCQLLSAHLILMPQKQLSTSPAALGSHNVEQLSIVQWYISIAGRCPHGPAGWKEGRRQVTSTASSPKEMGCPEPPKDQAEVQPGWVQAGWGRSNGEPLFIHAGASCTSGSLCHVTVPWGLLLSARTYKTTSAHCAAALPVCKPDNSQSHLQAVPESLLALVNQI